MPSNADGHVLDLSPSRVDAMISLANARGASRYLGVPVRDLAKAVELFARRARALLGRSSLAGHLRSGGVALPVFVANTPRRTYRVITGPLEEGRHRVLAIDASPTAAPPPSYLGELETLEYDLGGLKLKPRWSAKPMTRAQIIKKYGAVPKGGIYVAMSPSGKTVMKVGQSDKLQTRYPDKKNPGSARWKFYVGTLGPTSDAGGAQGGAEAVAARRLLRGGAKLPQHVRPRSVQKVYGHVDVQNAIPRPLQTRHRDPDAPGGDQGRVRVRGTRDRPGRYEV